MIYALLFSVMHSGLALVASHYGNANAVCYFSVGACVALVVGVKHGRTV